MAAALSDSRTPLRLVKERLVGSGTATSQATIFDHALATSLGTTRSTSLRKIDSRMSPTDGSPRNPGTGLMLALATAGSASATTIATPSATRRRRRTTATWLTGVV